ncbi:hypothetical protein HQ571_00940 [Candidatus Kuenenbacteria bacterium]|nr:hypothetical protein [Candidatus Kuenenbacteria bacterium]
MKNVKPQSKLKKEKIVLISTPQNSHFSVAIGDDQIEKFKIVNKPYKQSELLLQTIDELVKSQKSKVKSLFVVKGPGQFSALRIGISTANALAYGWGIPVVGIELKKSWEKLEPKEKLEKVWQVGVKKLKKTKPGVIVLPKYGKEPNIT